MWKVPLFELNYDLAESSAVADVLESRWLTMGEQIHSFEQQFSTFLGEQVHSTAVSSCTAALHIALLSAGVGEGDEVIIPALTFVADANVVRMCGATPVLADCSSLENWNVSAKTIAARITDKTKAVIIVHFAGYPCDMAAIQALCKTQKLLLIEDVAHAPGARYQGQACGTFGDMACFSFFTNKNLSIGEGGMFVTRKESIDRQAQYFRSHGMTTLTLDRHKGRAISYDVQQPGLNYRMDEIRAALGLVQLGKLLEANQRRGDLVKRYQQQLEICTRLEVPFQQLNDVIPSYHIFPVLLDTSVDRVAVIERLRQAGIQSSIHYPSFREFTAYQASIFPETPVADEVSRRVLTLPLFPTMTLDQVDWVASNLVEACTQ